jgi:hypothetical protein
VRRAPALVLALAIVACKPTRTVDSDAPDSLRFLAVVELDDAGAPAAAGPLVSWSPGRPLPVIASGPALLLGYDDATLDDAGLLAAAQVAGPERLGTAGPCHTVLPDATWLGSWDGDDVVAIDPAATPRLSAGWLRAACPAVSPLVGFDDDCAGERCVPRLVRDDGCERTFALEACGLGEAFVAIDAQGRVCATIDAFEACEVERTTGFARLSCDGPACGVTVSAPLERDVVELNVEITSVFPAALRKPDNVENMRQPFRYNLYEGYLMELVVLDDQVVLTAPPGDTYGSLCRAGGVPERRLIFLDSNLRYSHEIATEDCLQSPVRDPRGDGFIAVYGTSPYELARFDARGARTASVSFAVGAAEGITENAVHETFVVDDATIVVVVNAFGNATRYAGVRTFDLETLAPTGSHLEPAMELEFAIPDPPGRLIQLDRNVREWWRLDLETGDRQHLATSPLDVMLQATLFDLHGQGPYAIAAGRGRATVQGLTVEPRQTWQAATYEAELHVFTMAAWPADARYVLMAGGIFRDYDLGAALFDVETRRFVPTTTMIAGESSITRLVPDGRGGLLALLPWNAKIARISPRAP